VLLDGAQMLRKLLLWIVAVIGVVAISQSASAEVAEGATWVRGSISWNVTGPQRPLHVNFGASPARIPGAVSLSVFTHAATSFASQSIARIFTPRRGAFHA
jgi:hypothetical protein